MASAWSIWSQTAPKLSPMRPRSRAAGDGVLQEPGGLRPAGVGRVSGPGGGALPEGVGDAAGAGEVDQAAHEVGVVLGAGQQPQGQAAGGDVVDGAAAGVGFGDAAADQPLVEGHVPRRPALRGGVSGHRRLPSARRPWRCRGRLGPGGDAEELLEVLAGDQAAPADLEVVQVAAAHLVVQQVAGQAGQPGGLVDGVGQPLGGRSCVPGWPLAAARGPRRRACCAGSWFPGRVPCAHPAASGSAGSAFWPGGGPAGRVWPCGRGRRGQSGRARRPSLRCGARAGARSSTSPGATVSARTMAVMALLRSRCRPGSQDTSHWCCVPGTARRCARCGRCSCCRRRWSVPWLLACGAVPVAGAVAHSALCSSVRRAGGWMSGAMPVPVAGFHLLVGL